MLDESLCFQARELVEACRRARKHIATAESCTGGLIGHYLSLVPGSAEVFEGGLITYTHDAKARLLGVPRSLLDRHGAISEEVVRAMAEGALARSGADIAVAVSGVAGEEEEEGKPPGFVHLAAAARDRPTLYRAAHYSARNRGGVCASTVHDALSMLRQQVRAAALV